MKPYYDDGQVVIYHADCREMGGCDYAGCVLPPRWETPFCEYHHEAEGEPAVAVVTDPPYGVAYKPGGQASGKGRNGPATRRIRSEVVGDDQPFDPAPWLQFTEAILWGANHYASTLPLSPSWLVWDKRKGTASDNHADCELAWTNLGGPARLHSQLWRGMIREGEHNATPRVHPTQKPETLMRWCIGLTASLLVLDPFMGSGTTLKAAKDLGRKAIGIELEESYCEIAAHRLSQEVLDLSA